MGWECLGRTCYLDSEYLVVVSPTCMGTRQSTCVSMRGLLFSYLECRDVCVFRDVCRYGQQLPRVCKDTKRTPRGDGGGMRKRSVHTHTLEYILWSTCPEVSTPERLLRGIYPRVYTPRYLLQSIYSKVSTLECLLVTVVQIGATERAIERIQVEVSCECRLSHGYDIISLGHSGMVYNTYL
jgi:hypothetical protein